ncbi:MAG TPA: thioredoxin family protein [Acidimicrobiia bacterium]|nr:thioredoxin family protein [Acidimicrobiia bacterium]
MEIKVLGSGCANCKALEARTVAALDSLGLEAAIEKVTDFAQIVTYDVMSTPALVINEKVVTVGRVPSVDELYTLLAGIGS